MTMHAQIGDVPRVLDVSRTVARGAERAPTGIDRAERAYLAEILEQPAPVFGLVRTPAGFLLLDRNGLTELHRALTDPSRLGVATGLSRALHRQDPARAKLETLARRHAIARASRWRLGKLFQHYLPVGTEYLNVGHSNLSDRVFQALARVPQSSSTVVLHDLLPLTHPQYNRPVAGRKSDRMVRVIAKHAGRVVHISKATRASNEKQLARLGRVPPGLVAPLGVRVPVASQDEVIPAPYFLAIGTLEPRKNLGFLLDLWEWIASQPDLERPVLILAGARGWESDAFFDRLIRHRLFDKNIRWIESPDDARLDALLFGTHGLLFPSHAEGQGLPPLEAASIGVPVICQPLPPLTEFLGNYAHQARCDDLAGWIEKIKGLLAGQSPRRLTVPDSLPTWEQHFAMVLDGEMTLAAGGRADKGSAKCV